ncbi:probable glycosyltransferase, type 1 [Natronomonas pharaonis DSM 2160]|uniref:Probable glycosyltransferase, type 1 n=1 Tax=Natronomonas pharaonis (strain ATCC 35678 / DSM 2160 / CIP 103997 / JCM 8858 / NBRC 14720 / NCIMB 2260 / Gabara) TaxID=348780 RepID=A0A1U7EX73_NATPD|nr:glycosyltransferase family 4 protein [Natronomonas pharaonis]CAI49700.1 probable glycosyltransferase, type 1 [Natronomonas pharaonis DSM 2160]
MRTVAAFTDTYLPTVNGVSYTASTWRDRWCRRGGRMPLVYPAADGYQPEDGEHPVGSVRFPWYEGFRLGRPAVPDAVERAAPDVVHAHTPFALGLAAARLAARSDAPLIVSYHTPVSEYAGYVSDAFADAVGVAADRYERWFLNRADAVVAPSQTAAERIDAEETPVYVVSNGVDTDRFRPVGEHAVTAFRDRYGLPDGPLVGYTGRHGREKRLGDVLAATAGLDAGVVIAGAGPATPELRRRTAAREDVRLLGFLERNELPAFYTALDAFAFPSPVETQGLVALEAIACGTPVVAADGGALPETVDSGETGCHFPVGDVRAFRTALRQTLARTDVLSDRCVARREQLAVERAIDRLGDVYETVTHA